MNDKLHALSDGILALVNERDDALRECERLRADFDAQFQAAWHVEFERDAAIAKAKRLREALDYLRRKIDGYDTTFAFAEAYAEHGEKAVESGAVEVNCE